MAKRISRLEDENTNISRTYREKVLWVKQKFGRHYARKTNFERKMWYFNQWVWWHMNCANDRMVENIKRSLYWYGDKELILERVGRLLKFGVDVQDDGESGFYESYGKGNAGVVAAIGEVEVEALKSEVHGYNSPLDLDDVNTDTHRVLMEAIDAVRRNGLEWSQNQKANNK